MRSSLRHIASQPFVVATGFAALVHSTWSLATLFAGHEPEQFTPTWLAWVAPALLIALSIDLGQVVTAAEIRNGQRNRIKLATFVTFAVATYGLQWFHLAHHSPLILLADGVRKDWQPFAQFLSDAMLWFVPALLPLSTLLYTFSSSEVVQVQHANETIQVIAPSQQVNVNILQPAIEAKREIAEASHLAIEASQFIAECVCGFRKVCDTKRSATNSRIAHQRHCEKYKLEVVS